MIRKRLWCFAATVYSGVQRFALRLASLTKTQTSACLAALLGNWQSDFHKRFPPIDDDEFVTRCNQFLSRPSDCPVNVDIALRARRIIAEQLGIRYEQVYPEQSFIEDLNCD